ncbi:hypothetical protein GCM10010992_03920 [Cloacibacterium rupense]|uniref:Peptidase M48 domain-containing protein n=1 Tax=Cloacibacterium rupense TaxID=517423 RepID=A0ABQ2NF66_9FLAO|nr:M48 family metallopeptidase [Cloacibacterium rupense]GGP01858.1 hypothetical protein GCM10010992_03920 [Cloacibacterium rupense]
MTKNLPPISKEYKKQVTNSILFIILFFFIYLLLIFLSLVLVAAIGYLVYAIISNLKFNYLVILVCGGLIGMGVFILIFLVKFIFNFQKNDTSAYIEIKRNTEPELFKLIDEVVNEVGTEQPKKVFLSNDVNAFVNYNSTFWSMFLPVKKNLTIGMGLINTTTVSELKAILAHEFGHFSQKSMKVGSYVNQANKMIYDMLYNNKDLTDYMDKFASAHAIIAIFTKFAVWFIMGIQWILAKFYDFLYLKHMSLSRQMEFNADAIATYVVGSEVKSASLLRLDLSDAALGNSLNFYLDKNVNADTKNIYQNQTTLLHYLSKENNHEVKNGLPYINENELDRYNKSKLQIEDQWASHPTIQQRITAIKKLNIPSENIDSRLAKNIVKQFDQYAEKFTDKLFEYNMLTHTGNYLTEQEFEENYKNLLAEKSFPKIFNSYYDVKNPVCEDFDKIKSELLHSEKLNISKNELFDDEKVSLIFEKNALDSDSKVLEMIQKKTYKLKTFDYDGVKYTQKQTSKAQKILSDRMFIIDNEIKKNDDQIFKFIYQNATTEQKLKFSDLVENFTKADKEFDDYFNAFQAFVPYLDFMSQRMEISDIMRNRNILLPKENIFKGKIKELITSHFGKYMQIEDKQILDEYVDADHLYFEHNTYNNNEIERLNTALGKYQEVLSSGYFKMKKEVLNLMEEILQN